MACRVALTPLGVAIVGDALTLTCDQVTAAEALVDGDLEGRRWAGSGRVSVASMVFRCGVARVQRVAAVISGACAGEVQRICQRRASLQFRCDLA